MNYAHLVCLSILSALLASGCASTRPAPAPADPEPGPTDPAPETDTADPAPETDTTDPAPTEAGARPPAIEHGPCVATGEADRHGFVTCEDGRVHRPAAVECPSSIVADEGAEAAPGNPDDKCTRNADCTEKPHGYCAAEGQLPDRTCHYGCVTDADCGEGALCMCDNPVGRCLPASCLADADCGEGLLCTHHVPLDDMFYGAFACDTAKDECNKDDDCASGDQWYGDSCVLQDGARRCVAGARPVM